MVHTWKASEAEWLLWLEFCDVSLKPTNNEGIGVAMWRTLTVVLMSELISLANAQSPATVSAKVSDRNDILAQEILAIKSQYDVAQLQNDGAWFQRMFADDYVFVLPDSTVVTKAEFVRDLDSRDLVWESVSAKDERARIYGDTAVVTGKFFGRGKYKGAVLDERQLFTSVWIKRKGRWLAISEHATMLPSSARK